MRTLLPLLAVALLIGCGPGGPSETASGDALEIVPVTAAQLQDEVRRLDADAVVVNVWATWCGPCRSEFPEFVRFARDTEDQGVEVRFLSVDEPELRQQVGDFLAQYGARGRTYLSAEGTTIVATLAAPNRWTYGIPVTLVYGPDGQLLDFWEGAVTYDFLQAKVERVREMTAAG
jgi:thiol-disulfide isomerase/thioredoxin